MSLTCYENCQNVPTSARGALLTAFDPENDFALIPWLEENLQRLLSPDEIIMGSMALYQKGIKNLYPLIKSLKVFTVNADGSSSRVTI